MTMITSPTHNGVTTLGNENAWQRTTSWPILTYQESPDYPATAHAELHATYVAAHS